MGVIFFELLTGVLPYTSNYAKLEDDRVGRLPSPAALSPYIPQEVEKIVLLLMCQRHERCRSCYELLESLESYYDDRSLLLKVKETLGFMRNMLARKVG